MWRSHKGLLCCIALALAGCEGKAKETMAEQTGSAPRAMTGWQRIEALATPTVSAGPSNDLERAVEIARAHQDDWRDLRGAYPPAPLAAYPQGAEAIEALHAWVAAKGGLPPPPKATELGRLTLGLHDVGLVAIESAADASSTAVSDGVYLATRLVAEGRNVLEVQVGVSMLEDAKRKLRALAGEAGSGAAALATPAPDFVRILAAEALHSRRLHDFATSPEGRKELVELVKGMPGDTKRLLEGATGRTAMSMIPTDEEAAAMMQFWIAALDGAQRGEPVAATLERVRKAADRAGPAKQTAVMIASMIEMLKSSFERLNDPSAF